MNNTEISQQSFRKIFSVLVLILCLRSSVNAAVCPADWTEDGVVTTQDLFAFLGDWFSGSGDFNRDSVATTQDIFDFLSVWFASGSNANCGGTPDTLRDSYFAREYVRPSLDILENLSGFRVYDGDVIVICESAGIRECRIWNKNLTGFSATVANADNLEELAADTSRVLELPSGSLSVKRGLFVVDINN